MTVLPNIYDREQLVEFAAAPDAPPLDRATSLRASNALYNENFGIEEAADDLQRHDDGARAAPVGRAMKPEHVLTPHAPEPIGPYSQAIHCGSELYCSGQIRARSRRPANSSTATSPRRRSASSRISARFSVPPATTSPTS